MRIQKIVLLLAVGVLMFALAGCGDDSQDNTTDDNPAMSESTDSADEGATQSKAAAGKALALAANPDGELKYDKTTLEGEAGNITIEFTNDSSTTHDVVVDDADGKELAASDQIAQSKTSLDLGDVKAGDYTFFCSLPGHEAAGMKGTLTVQ